MNEPTVILSQEGALGIITLNRPKAGNTINMAMALELEAVVDKAIDEPTVRCLVLTGNGRLFCGGGDVSAFASEGDNIGAYLLEIAHALHRSVTKLAAAPKPVVTLINGPAAGAGLSLAVLSDVAIAAQSAHFTAAYAGVGLTPDGGASWFLPRLVGLRRAQDMMFTNRRVDAQEAASIGLVTRVVADTDLMQEGLAVARALMEGPVSAFGGTRSLLAQSLQTDLPSQLDSEAKSISRAGATLEAREGIAAFLDRRSPDFIGKS
jgi:2-(1,2-epoxy-1,2-dihydrophenyl)acetyl-CoA isomerase